MQLIITDTASKWFQQKYNLVSGDGIKLYGKTIQPHNVKQVLSKGMNLNRRSMRQQSS